MVSADPDGWVDDLRFYDLFISISVISGQWADDNARLGEVPGTPFMLEKVSPQAGSNPGWPDQCS